MATPPMLLLSGHSGTTSNTSVYLIDDAAPNVLSDGCWPVIAARRQRMSWYLRGRLKGEFGEFVEFVWVEVVFQKA